MADVPTRPTVGLTTRDGQPLIGIPDGEGPEEVVRYFASEDEADRALSRDQSGVQRALSAIGAWSDLDFDDMLDALDRNGQSEAGTH